MTKQHDTLIDELIKLLEGGSAHVSLKVAVKGLPAEMRGIVTNKLPYTIWQIVEHIRIAQLDMLEFSKDGAHESPKWPDEYWPKEAAPANDAVWRKSIKQIESDLEEFVSLMKKSDIYKPIPHGDGQSILREALQIADHNAYHTAEIGWLIPCRSLFVACCSESETWLMGHCKLRIPYSKLVSIASSINPRLLREHELP